MQIPEQSNSPEQSGQSTAISTSIVRRATGPRTKPGKRRSKHNALTHGIFSQVVVLKGESRTEFDSLLRGLRNDLKPEGTLEEALVDELAALLWRRRRLLIAEGAEIRKGTEFLEWEEKRRQEDQAVDITFFDVEISGLMPRIANPEVLETCLELLQGLNDGIEEDGFDEEKNKAILARLYGESGGDSVVEKSLIDIYSRCVIMARSNISVVDDGETVTITPEECKYTFLHSLNKEIRRLKRYKRERAQIESNRMEIESLRRNVPDAPQLDRLLKYETTLGRTFDRILNRLERLQSIRSGQPAPPSLNVNLSL